MAFFARTVKGYRLSTMSNSKLLSKIRQVTERGFEALLGNNANLYSNDPDYLQKAVKRTIAERLKKARLAALMDEDTAAAAFGYKNKSQIALLESGERPCPNWVIYRACSIYAVRADYLLGIFSENDLHPVTAERLSLRHTFNGMVNVITDKLSDTTFVYLHSLMPLNAEKIQKTIMDALNALAAIRKSNPSFDEDIKGGNLLLTKLIAAKDLADSLVKEDKRRRAFLDKQKIEIEQLQLNFEDLGGGGDDN